MLPKEVEQHCLKYNRCIGCPFVGQICTAPASPHKYKEWLENMTKLIIEVGK